MKQQAKNYSLTACALAVSALLSACGGGNGVVDDVAPTVAIAAPSALTNGRAVFTLTFSEDVGDSFELADVTVAGGVGAATLTPKAESDGLVYELSVTAPEVVSGQIAEIRVTVATDKFEDLVGNANIASAEGTFTIDKKAPVVDTTNAVQPVYANGIATFTLKFDEPVSLKDANLITVTNGTKGTMTPSSGLSNTFQLPVTPSTGAESVTVTVKPGSFQDAQGNVLGGSDFTQTVPVSGSTQTGTTLLSDTGLDAAGFQLGTGGSATAASGVVNVVLTADSGRDASGNNSLAGVKMFTQPGDTVPTFSLSPQQKTVQLRIKAPGAATTVKLKFEKTGTTVTAEADAKTVANNNDWQMLTFTFNEIMTGGVEGTLMAPVQFDKIVLFPDADFTRVPRTIYVDDVILMPASTSTQDPNSVLPDAGLQVPSKWNLGANNTGNATVESGVVKIDLAEGSGKNAAGQDELAGLVMASNTGGTVTLFSLSPTRKKVQLRIKASGTTATKVKLKFEKSGATPTVTAEADAETVANNNDWQTLTFTFDKIMTGGVEGALTAAVQFDKIVLFPDVNYTRVPRTIYVDDVILLAAEEPTDPGDDELLSDTTLDAESWGLAATDVAYPTTIGVNRVIQVDIAEGASLHGGLKIFTDSTNQTVPAFTLSSLKKKAELLVKVPGVASKILLKFESSSNPNVIAKAEATTLPNQSDWQVLTFTFDKLYTKNTAGEEVESSLLNTETTFNKIAIFPDYGSVPAPRTMYFDTIKLLTSGTETLINFDGEVDFDGWDDKPSNEPSGTIVVDPEKSTNKVAQVTFPGLAVTASNVLFGSKTDPKYTLVQEGQSVFSSGKILTLRVCGKNGVKLPAGLPVELRIEDSRFEYNQKHWVQQRAVVADVVLNANGADTCWQTLTFDFGSTLATGSPAFDESYGYNKPSILFNIGKGSVNLQNHNYNMEQVYLFDDLKVLTE